MYIIHEGQIVLKEKYGSDSERFYVKPPEQSNIVVFDEGKSSHTAVQSFMKIFLPQGYPDSVSKDYIAYQVWDTAQAFCSTITGTLATQEVLRGVGVGDTTATPLAATVTWVIKDGCGHIGRILFAYTHGTQLDAYSKKWRLYADTLNDAAMCIEIALPLFKNYTLFALCVSTVMKAIVGVAGGATRVAMTQHHATRGNLGDVSAKDSAQETAVNLVASITALLIITLIGNSLSIFLLMMVLHIVFNYLAVRAVCLRTFNEPRLLQVIDTYLKREVISTPCHVNRHEPIIFYQLGPNLLDLKLCGFKIKLGYSIQNLIKHNPKATYMYSIKEIYEERGYILFPNIGERDMYVLIKDNATNDDLFCAYLHAVMLSVIISALNDEALAVYQSGDNPTPFAELVRTLQSAAWSREPAESTGPSGFQYEPSLELLKYFNQTAQKEWRRIKPALKRTGWDLSKHLLVVDEWRISSHTFEAEPLTADRSISEQMVQTLPRFASSVESELVESSDRKTFIIEPYMSESTIRLMDTKKEQGTSVSEYRMELEKRSKTDTLTPSQTETLTPSQTETLTPSQTETLTPSQTETHTRSQTETHTQSQTETLTQSQTETHIRSLRDTISAQTQTDKNAQTQTVKERRSKVTKN